MTGEPTPRTARVIGWARTALARHATLTCALSVGLVLLLPLIELLRAHSANGVNGFPLDDAWIHLTFARHLHDWHRFAYSLHDAPTAGSTSPLYTALLAVLFGIIRDEKILSYALDLVFHAVFLGALARWAMDRLGRAEWAIAVVLLVGLDTRVGILAVSGMETSLFLALVALAFCAHLRGRALLCGIVLGLAVWTRPEGLILAAILFADTLADTLAGATSVGEGAPPQGNDRWRRAVALAAPFAVFLAAYCAFNYHLSGQLLPNTFAAKRAAIYPPIPPGAFLGGDVLPFLTNHGWIVLFPALVAGLAWEIWDAVHRRFGRARPEALWLVSVLAAYALLLPIGHRFDRYLVPVLPAAAILAVGTLQRLALVAGRATGWLRHTAPAIPVALACAALLHVAAPVDAVQSYTTWCRYHWVRHERAGRWLAAHTPANAVVATHDIGAIGYYSQREIVDIAGLVSPDVVAHVRQPDFTAYLADLFARRHVTHVAMLREWMQVSNVAPLFVADPEPEILEVYAWIPGVTHLVSREATSAALAAQGLLRAGRIQEALAQARASVQLDSLNADGWTVLGYLEGTANDPAEAFTSLQRALHLRPGDRQTRMGLVRVDIDAGRTEQARALLAALIAESPHDKDALELSDKLPAAPPAAPRATPR